MIDYGHKHRQQIILASVGAGFIAGYVRGMNKANKVWCETMDAHIHNMRETARRLDNE